MATYRDAGVDIAAGNETVRRITPLVRRTFTPGVLTDIGAFGGFFALNPGDYQQPVLVSSIDGVGTKLKVAAMAGRHDTVGEDLVNHCVNDIAVCGARPLFFLDYYATGTLHPDVAYDVISGFTRGCEANGCALIGGETAEMPGIYSGDDYDLAGCVVGVVERGGIVKGDQIRAGDVLVGLPSTGLHTNGYSLARKVLFERFGVHDRPDALGGQSLADALLAVHRSYLTAHPDADRKWPRARLLARHRRRHRGQHQPHSAGRPRAERGLRRLGPPGAVPAYPGSRRGAGVGRARGVQPRHRARRRRRSARRRGGDAGVVRGRRAAGAHRARHR